MERKRIREFLDQDLQFDLRWAEFLIKQTKNASLDPNHYWEGSANANRIVINGNEARIKPLYDQHPDELVLPHKTFIDRLEGWLHARGSGTKR